MDFDNFTLGSSKNRTLPAYLETRDEELAKVEIGILGTIFAVALLGNAAVLSILLWRKKKVHSKKYSFLNN